MPMFQYKAATAAGEVVEGQMEASSQSVVIRRLQAQGHLPIRAVELKGGHARGGLPARVWGARKVTEQDIALVTLELSTLLQAGLPLDRALEMLSNLTGKEGLRDLLNEIHRDVRGGRYLSAALDQHERYFSSMYRNMVRAGEATGALDMALARLTEFFERSRELRDALVSALIYPLILVFVGFLSLGVILGVVVPRISEMFTEAGQTLPLPTQIVVALGAIAQTYGPFILVGLVGLYIYARGQYQKPGPRRVIDGWFLSVPVLRNFIGKVEAARFTRTLGTLVGNGIPLLDGLAIAKEVVGNQVVAAELDRVAARVRQGEGLAKPLAEVQVFPELVGHLLQVGEESGNLEAMLARLAEINERDVRGALKRILTIAEPVLILGLAVVTAAIILSIVLALLSMNELAF